MEELKSKIVKYNRLDCTLIIKLCSLEFDSAITDSKHVTI